MTESDMPGLPAFLRRSGGPKVDVNRLNDKPDRRLREPTDMDKKVGELVISELGKKGIKATVTYVPSYLSSASVKITVDVSDGGSTHGVSRWVNNIIDGIPEYSVPSDRRTHSGIEYTIKGPIVEQTGWGKSAFKT